VNDIGFKRSQGSINGRATETHAHVIVKGHRAGGYANNRGRVVVILTWTWRNDDCLVAIAMKVVSKLANRVGDSIY
jgi:hypothetical protein